MESYMEALAISPEGMYTSEDDDMIMSQLLANYCSVTNELNHQALSSQNPSANFPSSHECSTATNMEGIANLYSHRVMATNHHNQDDFCLWDPNSATNMFLSQSGENGGMDKVLSNANAEDHQVMSENSKKRSCSTSVDHVQKNKRNVKLKKEVLTRNIEDSCSSGDDESMITNSHQDSSPKGAATLNLNCKTRARGLATDSQSTYARKRREKINERLRILQNLVPNGTKVDISTMLEDAVEYVKFLQLQIKLLSSDELWMYAPVVNNGIGIGIHDLLNS